MRTPHLKWLVVNDPYTGERSARRLVEEEPLEECFPWFVQLEGRPRRDVQKAVAGLVGVAPLLAYGRDHRPRGPSRQALVELLAGCGPSATPDLEAALVQSALVAIAAEALRTSDPPYLLARAARALEEQDPPATSGTAPSAATGATRDLTLELLRAVDGVSGVHADRILLRGVASSDAAVAEWSRGCVSQRLRPEALVDALVDGDARALDVGRVEPYAALLRDAGAAGADRAARSLDRLLTEAGGDPDRVAGLHKRLGLPLLAAHGASGVVPLLERYLRGSGSFVGEATELPERAERVVPYSELARQAIERIQARSQGAR